MSEETLTASVKALEVQLRDSADTLSRQVESSAQEKQEGDRALSALQAAHDAALATREQLRVCEWRCGFSASCLLSFVCMCLCLCVCLRVCARLAATAAVVASWVW